MHSLIQFAKKKCISTCPRGQHLASHEPVCDPLLRKCEVRQRCFEIKCASVSHVAHAEVQSLCQEGTENSGCDIKCIEGYTFASNTLKCKAVDFKTALETWIGNVSCRPKSCGVPPSLANTLRTSMERHYLDSVTNICKSGYSLNGLRYGKKEFLLGCKSDGTYDVPHLTCQPINCTLEDAPTVKMIEFSGGSLPSSSPVALGPDEWLRYQCGEGHTLSGIPGSSDLFSVRCLGGDHTMTHLQTSAVWEIRHATPLGVCFVIITYGKQVEYQCEAGYHVESERKSGSKPEACHAKERAEPEQPVQEPEEPVGAVSSCGHVDPPEERFASWIGQQDRPVPSQSSSALLSDLRDTQPEDLLPRRAWAQFYEWPQDWSRAGATKCLSGQFLSRALQARGRRLACISPDMSGEPSWSVTCEKWKVANSWN